MILRNQFGRTGHASTRIIFGAYALSKATQAEADRILYMLLECGVNHIDTAPMYGNAEKVIGPWFAKHRNDFFVATKTRRRSRPGALDDLKRSCMHACISPNSHRCEQCRLPQTLPNKKHACYDSSSARGCVNTCIKKESR